MVRFCTRVKKKNVFKDILIKSKQQSLLFLCVREEVKSILKYNVMRGNWESVKRLGEKQHSAGRSWKTDKKSTSGL